MNQKLKFAYGYVLATASLILIAYAVLTGTIYLTGGDMLLALPIAGALVCALATGCVALQRLKASDSHFDRNLLRERITLPLMVATCVAAMVPLCQFVDVQQHGAEVEEALIQTLDASEAMLSEYDRYAQKRVDHYRSDLRSAVKGKSRERIIGTPPLSHVPGADTIMVNNLAHIMQMRLGAGDDSLRQGAKAWLSRAREGATVWNIFLAGNVRHVGRAVDQWYGDMEESSMRAFPGEKAAADSTHHFASAHIADIRQGLDRLDRLYTTVTLPSPLALLTGTAALLLLFLPYCLQERNTRSRVSLGGKATHKAPLDIDHDYDSIHRIHLLDEVSIPMGQSGASPSATDRLRDLIAASDQPIDTICQLEQAGRLDNDTLLRLVHQDCNLLDAATLSQCLQQGRFTREQLLHGHEYLEGFVDMLGTPMTDMLPADRHIERLDDGCTEFYFWGIPSSGKTCAIGAVINAAREKTVATDITVKGDCQGYEYLSELMNVFKGRDAYCVLPGRTPVDANFAMRLNLTDYKGRVHPVTIIDMAGELFCHLYWRDHQIAEHSTHRHDEALASLERILQGQRTTNRKFHFFIIEYGAEKKRYKGFTQDEYLCHGLRYLDATGVLSDATDGICVIVTKYDHLFTQIGEDEDINNHLSSYLYRNYGGFLRLLRSCCQRYEINGGTMPDPVPFCIGDVCFKNYCRISTEYAKDIVKIILRESKGFKRGRLARMEAQLRK